MISVTELRAGRTFKLLNEPYQVVEYRHTKLGRGTANIRVKVRNLRTGDVTEKTFTSGAKVELIETEVKALQYLYGDGKLFYFMEPQSFEQFSLPAKIFGQKAQFLKEGEKIKILFWEPLPGSSQDKEPLSFELPNSLIFEVVETSPGVKGDTALRTTKSATLENGLVVRVPLFIKKGDKIKVDTRKGEYLERVRKKLT